MKSILYAIADAGGNVYPHTFRTDGEWAKSVHILTACHADMLPVGEVEKRWAERALFAGDHVVKCSIETSENVTVTQIP